MSILVDIGKWVGIFVGVAVALQVLVFVIMPIFDALLPPAKLFVLVLYLLPFGLAVAVVLITGWQLSSRVPASYPLGDEATRVASFVVVGCLAYQASMLKVPVRRRLAQRRLRAQGVIDDAEDVQAVVRCRVRRLYSPRNSTQRGDIHELCPANGRISAVATLHRVVIIRRSRLPGRARAVAHQFIRNIPLLQARVSLYRSLRGTTVQDVDNMESLNFSADEFAIVLTDRSGVFLTGGPPSEVDQLRRVTGRITGGQAAPEP